MSEVTTAWISKAAKTKLKAALLKKRGTTLGMTEEISHAVQHRTKEILAEE